VNVNVTVFPWEPETKNPGAITAEPGPFDPEKTVPVHVTVDVAVTVGLKVDVTDRIIIEGETVGVFSGVTVSVAAAGIVAVSVNEKVTVAETVAVMTAG
jgi:hypothetical protein